MFVRIKEGFLYNPLDHSRESHCLVSRYVSTGWILTREAMLDLIVSGLAKPSLYTDYAKVLIWTDERVWTVGKRSHPDWTLVGYLQWKWVRPQRKLVWKSFNDLILGQQAS
ncbi:hypothetical protein TNCV_1005611 [Trichonephila clavipes]|uniref:Uncharacterized protein n=1 Tax=Trichonephila clavipes TaxID=2585209 RepID=A0A8X6R813_TRICX|nr:hypothetical protein TNCV_1005611 [Trichonephila clavipes]